VSLLVVVTVTFGITAPLASFTVPVSAPVPAVCAKTDETDITRKQKHKTAYFRFLPPIVASSVNRRLL
jgi:hypothetical protein